MTDDQLAELLNVCDYVAARREPIEIPIDAQLWTLIREAAEELQRHRQRAEGTNMTAAQLALLRQIGGSRWPNRELGDAMLAAVAEIERQRNARTPFTMQEVYVAVEERIAELEAEIERLKELLAKATADAPTQSTKGTRDETP